MPVSSVPYWIPAFAGMTILLAICGNKLQNIKNDQIITPSVHLSIPDAHVYKVAVLAFKNCSVFSAKDCRPDSILTAYWKNKDKPATQLKQGTRWFLTRDGSEVDVSSWSCEVKEASK
jgi:hypothetical protein